MATELALVKPTEQTPDLTAIERVIVAGDLSKLSADERWDYYRGVCRSLGLNPFTRPFEYITLSGKLVLYARKDCADQLREKHGVSVDITARERIDDLYVVTARATTLSGRHDEEIGAVTIGNLKGDALANALMKATTKAKRRVTLSICGLGMLDETELETIPATQVNDAPPVKSAREQWEEKLVNGLAEAKRLDVDVDYDLDPETLTDDELKDTVKDLGKLVKAARDEAAKQPQTAEGLPVSNDLPF